MKRIFACAAFCAVIALAQAAQAIVPRLAVVSCKKGRHASEYDFAVGQLGWTVLDRYKDTPESMTQLARQLDRYDLVLFTPLFNVNREPVFPGEDRAAFMKFLENGGMLAFTDGCSGEIRKWIADLDPRFKDAGMGNCDSTQWTVKGYTRDAEVPHSLRFFPYRITEPNWWGHFGKLSAGSAWQVAGLCGEGSPVVLCQRVGKGVLYLASVCQSTEKHLANLYANLLLARAGIELKSFAKSELNVGSGTIAVTFGGTPAPGATLVYSVTNEAGETARFTGRRKGDGITIDYHLSFRGPVTETLSLADGENESVLFTRRSVLPPLLAVIPNAYRGILSTARRLPTVTFGVELAPDKERIAGGRVRLAVISEDGKEVATDAIRLKTGKACKLRHPMKLSRGLPAGDYTLKATLHTAAGRKLAEAETTFKILAPRPAQTIVDEDLTLLVGGKPFFPIGIYHLHPNDYGRAKEIGFNTVTFWAWHLGDGAGEKSPRLRAAEEHGLKAIIELNHKGRDVVRAKAVGFRDDPAVLMWYGMDEPVESHYAQCRMMQETFNEHDIHHPVYSVSCRADLYADQSAFCDVFAVDPYGKPEFVLGAVTNATAALKGRKPLIVVPASFENSKPEIYRSELYIALASGARGVLWYPWSQMGGGKLGEGLKNHPEAQNVVAQLCKEVRALTPMLTSPDRRPFASDDGAVRGIALLESKTKPCILLVNATPNPVKAKLTIPGMSKWDRDMRDYFKKNGGVELKVRKGEFEMELKGYETRVFR